MGYRLLDLNVCALHLLHHLLQAFVVVAHRRFAVLLFPQLGIVLGLVRPQLLVQVLLLTRGLEVGIVVTEQREGNSVHGRRRGEGALAPQAMMSWGVTRGGAISDAFGTGMRRVPDLAWDVPQLKAPPHL